MNSKSVCCVGGDAAQSFAFEALRDNGLPGSFFLGSGKAVPWTQEISAAIAGSSAVLVGLSGRSPQSDSELAAIQEAFRLGKPVVVYEDTYGVWQRGQFQEVLGRIHSMFVIDCDEAVAVAQAFPGVKPIVVGNPTWDDYFFPDMDRKEVRQLLGVDEDRTMVLVSGVKELTIDIPVLDDVVNALCQDYLPQQFHVVMSLHPGSAYGPEPFQGLVDYGQSDKVGVSVITREQMPSAQALAGADLVVSPVSSLIIGAACQRIPVICWFNSVGRGRQLAINGRTTWKPFEMGIGPVFLSGGNDILGEQITRLLDPSAFEPFRLRQEKLFPKPEGPGEPTRKMTEYLLSL